MWTLISRLAALVACFFAAQAGAATVPVTVTVNSVRNISSGVLWSAPNFHAVLWIEKAQRSTPTVFSSQGFVSPGGWTFMRQVSRAARGGIASIRIELRNLDVVFGDSLVDIDPGICSTDGLPFGCADTGGTPPVDTFGIDVTLNLFDGSWSPVDPRGDSSMPTAVPAGVGQMACTSGAGNNAANICFTITVGSPRPELLAVSKTADSNRGFCAPGNCSLREAVTVAEDGDVIDLPASATPYLLADANSDGHLAIRPAPGDLPRQVHIRGPRSGGTAVIRQTLEPFRVFDVHAKAKLLLTRATITGGGAALTSTALPAHVHGGGIHNHGEIDLRHVTITGNRATYSQLASVGGGGGIYNASGALARLSNVTIAGNVSWPDANGVPLGGGIAGPGAYVLRNTLLANNAVVWPDGSAGPPSNCGAGTPLNITDEGGNLQYPGSDCGRWVTKTNRFGLTFTFWWPYFATASMDPLLPFDAERGIFVPLAMGPAIDAGVDGCGPTDQTGRTAPADGNGDGLAECDVGAIEAP
jgi:hypothetical protein